MSVRSKSRKPLILRLILISGVLAVLVLVQQNITRLFPAKNIECFTQYGDCPPTYLTKLTTFKNFPLLTTLPKSKVQASLSPFSEIKTVALYRKLPDTLVVSVQLRKPIGTIGPQVLGAHAIADEEGVIIGQTNQSTLPFLLDSNSYSVGGKISSAQVTSLKLLGDISQLTQGYVYGSISGNDLQVYLSDNTKIILDLTDLSQNWYPTLQVILSRSKILSKMPKVIDLRFSNPVLTF